jgi:hypothetical protein
MSDERGANPTQLVVFPINRTTMTEQTVNDKPSINGRSPTTTKPKGGKKEWKDLAVDPLAEGFDSHHAEYVVGKSPVSWSTVLPGQLISRTKSGKSLWVKLNDGRGVCLDTRQAMEVKPAIRNSMQVWLVTSFNSTSASKADF